VGDVSKQPYPPFNLALRATVLLFTLVFVGFFADGLLARGYDLPTVLLGAGTAGTLAADIADRLLGPVGRRTSDPRGRS
jgi:hypothetical protein